jgi:sugar lactone lactonase YvrE
VEAVLQLPRITECSAKKKAAAGPLLGDLGLSNGLAWSDDRTQFYYLRRRGCI